MFPVTEPVNPAAMFSEIAPVALIARLEPAPTSNWGAVAPVVPMVMLRAVVPPVKVTEALLMIRSRPTDCGLEKSIVIVHTGVTAPLKIRMSPGTATVRAGVQLAADDQLPDATFQV